MVRLGAVEMVRGGQQLERAAHADLPGNAEALHAVGKLSDVEVVGDQADPAAQAAHHAGEADRVGADPVGPHHRHHAEVDQRPRQLVPEEPVGALLPASLVVDNLTVGRIDLEDPTIMIARAVGEVHADDAAAEPAESCQVSDHWKIGPLTPHITMTARARANVAGRPAWRAVQWASLSKPVLRSGMRASLICREPLFE
jgi:hypothetical protein